MSVTFDPVNKRIVLNNGVTSVTATVIYSRWKEWAQINAQYLPAFRLVGGDPIGSGLSVASYFFLSNGWRVRPYEGNHTLIIEGNLLVDGGGVPVVPTLGAFNVSTQYTVPVQAQGISTAGSTGPTASEIAAAILAAATATPIASNTKQVNNVTITGTGTTLDPVRPA
jgi:hypothetical protein